MCYCMHRVQLQSSFRPNMQNYVEPAVYVGDGRLNYHPEQFKLQYLSSGDIDYLSSLSYPGMTVVDDMVFVLVTRLSSMPRGPSFSTEVSDCLLQIRRPLFRFLVFIGEKRDFDEGASVFSLPWAEPRSTFSGDASIWGTLPYIDGVKVIPPVQIAVPFRNARRLEARFDKQMPVIWVEEDRCIRLQRQHIVFCFVRYSPPGAWSFYLRDCLACGGRQDTVAFTGLRHMRYGSGRIIVAAGMVLGRYEYGVGVFGSLIRPDVARAYFSITNILSDHRLNVHVPFELSRDFERRENWPQVVRAEGLLEDVNPSDFKDRSDVLSDRGTRVFLKRLENGAVQVKHKSRFYDITDRDIREPCPNLPAGGSGRSRAADEEKAERRRLVRQVWDCRAWVQKMMGSRFNGPSVTRVSEYVFRDRRSPMRRTPSPVLSEGRGRRTTPRSSSVPEGYVATDSIGRTRVDLSLAGERPMSADRVSSGRVSRSPTPMSRSLSSDSDRDYRRIRPRERVVVERRGSPKSVLEAGPSGACDSGVESSSTRLTVTVDHSVGAEVAALGPRPKAKSATAENLALPCAKIVSDAMDKKLKNEDKHEEPMTEEERKRAFVELCLAAYEEKHGKKAIKKAAPSSSPSPSTSGSSKSSTSGSEDSEPVKRKSAPKKKKRRN